MATSASSKGKRAVFAASIGVALVMLLGGAASASHLSPLSHVQDAAGPVTPALGAPEQWAFGGSASADLSCTASDCLGEVLNNTSSFSFSLQYYIEWVVIYTQTNVSASQTQIEGQTALNVSAAYAFSECVNVTGKPCQTTSYQITLNGRETSTGFTNITDGTVDLSAGAGSPAVIAAQAVSNASSSAALNFSGSYSIQSQNMTIGSESASFDFGASESSSVSFLSPLGLVPFNPVPGDEWNASQAYTASGSTISGYSLSATELGVPITESKWTPGTLDGSGNLSVNGSDLGNFTLWDNHSLPHTNLSAQEILLQFSNGNFSGSDGWILIPTQLYSGLLGLDLAGTVGHPIPALAAHPSTTVSVTSGETAYYRHGSGFVGASEAGNSSIPGGEGKASVNLTAGPESVTLAEQQYAAITANPSSAGSLPLVLIVGIVVVAVVVVAIGALAWKRSARRARPPTPTAPPGGPLTPPPASP